MENEGGRGPVNVQGARAGVSATARSLILTMLWRRSWSKARIAASWCWLDAWVRTAVAAEALWHDVLLGCVSSPKIWFIWLFGDRYILLLELQGVRAPAWGLWFTLLNKRRAETKLGLATLKVVEYELAILLEIWVGLVLYSPSLAFEDADEGLVITNVERFKYEEYIVTGFDSSFSGTAKNAKIWIPTSMPFSYQFLEDDNYLIVLRRKWSQKNRE